MNNTDASPLTPQARDYFALWNDLIADGLGRILGASVHAEPQAGGSSGAAPEGTSEPGVWIRFFGGKIGEQAFFLAAPDAARLSQVLLGEAAGIATGEGGGEAGALSAEGRESLVQFFQQIATMIPASDWFGFKCELEASEVARVDWEAADQANFHFSSVQGFLLDLRSLLSADFSSALQSPKKEAKSHGEDADEGKPSKPSSQNTSPATPRDVNLNILMDVELDVTLRFGQREMLLGDVLNLAPGSVVELDQHVQDPVELLVGSKVIAWGEVVAVDGNYGLRITGLASREERLESLRK
ncbi:MAG: FliM/FliN family flagellar motor switch protein [Terriglobia bacterium]